MNAVNDKVIQQTTDQTERPPGGADTAIAPDAAIENTAMAATPKKIFVCSPYRPVSDSEKSRKTELEQNLYRAKTACRILAHLGFLPLAPHAYFTSFLKDEDKQERKEGIQLGLRWLEEADEVWVFGDTISEGMSVEIARAKELGKPVRNLPEPGRMVELLIKSISDNNKEQHKAAESETHNDEA